MSGSINIPIWLLFILVALAIVTSLQYFLLPPVRMIMRRRANRVIDEMNSRLALELPSFKLTKREVLIDRLVYHPLIMEEVERVAREENTSRDAVLLKVRKYATEIVPAFNAWLYFKTGYWLARKIVHLLYRVRLGYADDLSLSKLPQNSSVVFVMNHRSNMDYILATYLAAERSSLSYAVGEWARVWPLQQLIRSMGGYFVRRNSGDPLYRQVLQCYVRMAAEGGVPQAVFPEGKLTRNGALGKAKMGLLGYLARPFLERSTEQLEQHTSDMDLVFIPVGINYDRVFEDRTLLASLDSEQPRHGTFFTLRRFFGFIGKQMWLALTGRWYRFGYACVNFGTPLSLKEWVDDRKASALSHSHDDDWHKQVEALSEELMDRIGQIIPILPVAMVATIFRQASADRSESAANTLALSELDIKVRVAQLTEQLDRRGAHIYIPRSNMDYAVTVGLRMLELRRALINDNGLYRVNNSDDQLLDFYARSIAHLLNASESQQVSAVDDVASQGRAHHKQTSSQSSLV